MKVRKIGVTCRPKLISMDWFEEICSCPSMQRIRQIGMNCGCEYTSFPRFRRIGSYSRYDHSVGVGRIVYEHTGSVRQCIAGLLHDISTPVFAHVIDFMNGDHLSQESTEEKTLETISSDKALVAILNRLGLEPAEVSDYHLFPIADNDTPKLSADRLEYSLGNMQVYGFASKEEAAALYSDIVAGTNESGEPELMFKSLDAARRFAFLSLECSKVYVSDEDRYSMQRLAELVKCYVDAGVLSEADLWTTEPEVIGRICSTARGAADWAGYRAMHKIVVGRPGPGARTVDAKKRRIDPFVEGKGRVSCLCGEYASALQNFLDYSFDYLIDNE